MKIAQIFTDDFSRQNIWYRETILNELLKDSVAFNQFLVDILSLIEQENYQQMGFSFPGYLPKIRKKKLEKGTLIANDKNIQVFENLFIAGIINHEKDIPKAFAKEKYILWNNSNPAKVLNSIIESYPPFEKIIKALINFRSNNPGYDQKELFSLFLQQLRDSQMIIETRKLIPKEKKINRCK